MKPHRIRLLIAITLLTVLLACNLVSQTISVEAPTAQPPAQMPTVQAPAVQAPVTQAPQILPTAPAGANAQPIRQWAVEAQASSEYGNPDWGAQQATGAPNTTECGDQVTAWAASGSNSREWINLYFKTPVFPSEIHIFQTYNPDQVAQVDLIDMQGTYVPVYTGQPRMVESPCPFILSIPVNQSNLLAQGVRITLDQSVVSSWNEIDAVEIVGIPGEGKPVRPVITTP